MIGPINSDLLMFANNLQSDLKKTQFYSRWQSHGVQPHESASKNTLKPTGDMLGSNVASQNWSGTHCDQIIYE